MTTTSTHETTLTCPSWCALPAGHDFTSLTHGGRLVRWHESTELGSGKVSVIIGAEETADHSVTMDDGDVPTEPIRSTTVGAPYLLMSVGASDSIVVDEPRAAELAAVALAAAADRLAQVTGGLR